MRLLDLVKEHYGVRLAANGFRELSTFIIAYISWRSTDQTGSGELLLIFTHVNTCQHRLVIEEYFGQSLRQLRLPDTCSTEEDEGADRTLRVLEPCTTTADGISHSSDSLLLTDDTLVELFLEM